MKKTLILLFFICSAPIFSQSGKVTLKNPPFQSGIANTYIYQPPKGLILQENSKANTAYAADFDFISESNPVVKNGNQYEFTVKTADSARVMYVTFSDVQKIADNNNGKGYIVYLKTQNADELSKTLANEISVRGFINYDLKLKLDTKPETTLKDYEKLFARYPKLKNDKSYLNYLYEKNRPPNAQSKKAFLDFAAKCVKKNTEEYLMLASTIYQRQDMPNEKDKLDKEILARYPAGKLEKMKFIDSFFNHQDQSEAYILETIEVCKTKYKDSSKRTLIPLYHSLMLLYLKDKNLEKAQEIESHFYSPSGLYNQTAWALSGGDLTTPIEDIEFAAKVSKRSLDIIDKKKKENYDANYQGLFNTYADTYALILYKQGKYDEAFKYQDAVNTAGGLDEEGKERYLAMMDKVKSKSEVKKYIEKQINTNGVTSSFFLAKLREIYVAENLSLDDYEKLKQKTELLAKTNQDNEVTKVFGSTNAPDFTLKNIEGKEIKLSEYKGKIVVLDFWATWCGPCVASFPKMQELVSKYKDKNVAFLFVNTWEKGSENEILERVTNFITEKKYSFNVVLDSKTEVVDTYKIKAIPTRILIDKDGNILSFDGSESNLAALIDDRLK